MPELNPSKPNTPPVTQPPQNIPPKITPRMENGVLKFDAGMIDMGDIVESQARDIAAARMTEGKEQNEKNGWLKKNVNKIFKYNILAEYNRRKEYNKALSEVITSQKIFAGEKDFNKANIDLDEADKNVKSEMITKFLSEYEDDMLTKSERESKHVTNNSPITNHAKRIIDQYARGTISRAEFENQKNDLLRRTSGGETVYADNLMEIAEAVKSSLEHNRGLERLDYDINMTFGNARSSIKTQTNYNKFDKAVAWLKNSKFATGTKLGSLLVSEPAILAYAAIAGVATGAAKAVSSKYGNLALFGLGSAISGGAHAIKEGARLTEERAQVQRELVKGMTNEGKRRQEFKDSTYNMVKSSDIINNLDNNMLTLRNSQSPAEQQQLASNILRMVADVDARKRLGEMKGVDLVSYSNFANVEAESNTINQKIAEIKRILLNNPQAQEEYSRISNDIEGNLVQGEGGLEQKNKAFKKMRRNKMGAAFVKGTLVSAGIGLVASSVVDGIGQEYRAFGNPKFDGLVENISGHTEGGLHEHATPLESLRRFVSGEHPWMAQGKVVDNVLANGMHVYTPEGVNIVPDGHGHYTILGHGKIIAENVNLDNSGVPDMKTMDMLGQKGIISSDIITTGNPTQIINQTPTEYIKSHPDLFEDFKPKGWYDNNTSAFDHNEQKLWWGGVNNSGIDENGNYVFNISHMTQDGSFHNGLTSDQMEMARQGNLKIGLTVSDGTEDHIIPIKVDEHGNGLIPKDSDTANLLFENHDGHAVFLGDKAQVIDNRDWVSATYLGNGLETISTTAPGDLSHHMTLAIPTETVSYVADPIPVPLIPRTPLERAYHENKVPPYDNNLSYIPREGRGPLPPKNGSHIRMDDGNMAPIEPQKWDDGMMAPIDKKDAYKGQGTKQEWDDGMMAPIDRDAERINDIRRITKEYNDELNQGREALRRLGLISNHPLQQPRMLNQFNSPESIDQYYNELGGGTMTEEEKLIEKMNNLKFKDGKYYLDGTEYPQAQALRLINRVSNIRKENDNQESYTPGAQKLLDAHIEPMDETNTDTELDDSALHSNFEEQEVEAGELSADTDFVLSYIGENPDSLESKITRYISENDETKKPSFIIFESNPSKRDAFNSEIDRLEDIYPNIDFAYIPLPEDKFTLEGKYLQDYMKERLSEIYDNSGINQVDTKMTSGSTSKFNFEKPAQETSIVDTKQTQSEIATNQSSVGSQTEVTKDNIRVLDQLAQYAKDEGQKQVAKENELSKSIEDLQNEVSQIKLIDGKYQGNNKEYKPSEYLDMINNLSALIEKQKNI